jgi:8-oxo-dGTP pyrophosphatase MutT (NUDIX family)
VQRPFRQLVAGSMSVIPTSPSVETGDAFVETYLNSSRRVCTLGMHFPGLRPRLHAVLITYDWYRSANLHGFSFITCECTAVIPTRPDGSILLGLKSRGFGKGKYCGFGGKVDSTDNSVEAAAARELNEETGLPRSIALRNHGQIAYTFKSNAEFDLRIHVFSCQLDGSEELMPSDEFESPLCWFGNSEAAIPYDRMVRVYPFHFNFVHFHPVPTGTTSTPSSQRTSPDFHVPESSPCCKSVARCSVLYTGGVAGISVYRSLLVQ